MDAPLLSPASAPEPRLWELAPFRALDPAGRDRLAPVIATNPVPAGTELAHSGVGLAQCHVLLSGALVTYAHEGGAEGIVSLHLAPHLLCLADIVAGSVPPYSARLVEPSCVASFPCSALHATMAQSAAFLAEIVFVLSHQHEELAREVLALRTLPPLQRLVRWALAQDQARGEAGEFVSALSTEQVASLLGYSYSHFARKVLRAAMPALVVRGRRWILVDRPALEALAGGSPP